MPHHKSIPDPELYRHRNLEPIFYNQAYRHIRLKKTLIEWAKARDDYLSNVDLLISRNANIPPETLNPTDVNNLLWAVLGRPDDDGYGARHFADLDPPPTLRWLRTFERRENDEYGAYLETLKAARIAGNCLPPKPILHVGQLFPSNGSEGARHLSTVGGELIRWLMHHLDKIDLVDWTIAKLQEGRRPHLVLRRQIQRRLMADEPLAAGFLRFWRIVSSEGDWAISSEMELFPAFELERSLLTPGNKAWAHQELASVFRPRIVFTRSLYQQQDSEELDADSGGSSSGVELSDIAHVEVRIAGGDFIETLIEQLRRDEMSGNFWAEQLNMLTAQLRQVFDLFAAAGEANADMDLSSIHRPSVVPHDQNHKHESWTWIFDLLWQGWTHLDSSDPALSRHFIEVWQRIPYLAFRRLVLAAVRHSNNFTSREKLEALLNG